MKIGTKKRSYPYSKSRVFFNAIVAILSAILAFTLLANDLALMLYYLLSTSLITIATFLLKTHLYPKISEQKFETELEQTETNHTPWRMLLLTLGTLIALLIVPLLLARILSGPIWFVLIVSFMSGTSISEIIFYLSYKN